MTRSPFVFHTPTDYARTHPDLASALDEALDADTNPDTKARMLTGVAARTDLKAPHLRTLVRHLGHGQFTLLATLLNNPALARCPKVHQSVRDRISADAIPTLLHDLDDPAEYLPDLLLAAYRHSMFPDIPQRVFAAFPAEQIRVALDRILADYLTALTAGGPQAHSSEIPALLAFEPDQVDQMVQAVRAALVALAPDEADEFGYRLDHERYESALARLLSRPDLTPTQADALMDGLIALARFEEAQERAWREQIGDDTGFRSGWRLSRMFNGTTLPESALARALLCPPLRDALTTDQHVRTGITAAAVIEAITQGAPVTLLDDYFIHDAPTEFAALCVDRLAADPALPTSDTGLDTLCALARASVHAIGTPTWDALYALWMEVMPDTGEGCAQDQFAQLVNRRALNWADASTVPVLHRFAAWASGSPDPLLRRHAIPHLYREEQMVAATSDPAWEVRFEVLAHPEVTEPVMNLLAADPAVQVRWALAQHPQATSATLARLHADPDPRIRLAVAEHAHVHVDSLRALADDPDDAVRTAVAERFMSALAR